MNEKVLALAIVARDEATATLNKVNGSLNALGIQAGTTDQALGGLGKSLLGLGAATLAFTAAFKVSEFFKDSVTAAQEEQVSLEKLNASLAANVTGWNGNTAAVLNSLKAREQLGFSDDDLRNSLTLLVAGTHNLTAAMDVQSVAMDLARFKSITLQEATVAITTIEGGRARGLAQLGINIKDYATTAERLAAVEKVAGGQAEAFSGTTEGAFARAGAAMHDLQETIGAPFLDAMAAVAEAAVKAAQALQGFVHDAGDLIDRAARLGQTVETTAGRVPLLADAIDLVTGSFHSARDPADAWTAAAIRASQAAATLRAGAFDAATGMDESARAALGANVRITDLTITNVLAAAAQHALDAANAATTTELDRQAAANLALDAEMQKNLATAAAWGQRLEDNGAIALTFMGKTYEAAAAVNYLNKSWEDLNKPGGGTTTGTPGAGAIGQIDAQMSYAQAQAAKAADLARQAAADGRAAASAQASAARDAFSAAKSYGDTYFDHLHQKHLDALKDIHDRATAEISEEQRSVDARLAIRLALNAAPVTAAEKALAETQRNEQFRNLQDALSQAQTLGQTQAGGNFQGIRAAQEAISNFTAQIGIDKLRADQAAADAQARQHAANEHTALTTKQKANDTKYNLDVKAETDRYNALKKAYDNELAALNTHLANVKGSHQRAIAEIEALYKGFHIPAPGAAGSPTTIVFQVDGKTLWKVMSPHAFSEARTYQLSTPGSGD